MFRDEEGNVLGGHTSRYAAISPILAKALALREALTLVSNCNMGRTSVESDCQDLVKACRCDVKRGEIISIVKDIKYVLNHNLEIGIT